jgi:hypothetical protein
MGRHRWTTRLTVEDCPLYLCAGELHSDGVFAGTMGSIWRLYWFGPLDALQGSIEYTLIQTSSSALAIYIHRQCPCPNTAVDEQTIPLTTVRPHLGGKRFWFRCACRKRVGRLYLSPGQRVFRCRSCHNLTYRSAQEHDQRLYDLARDMPALLAARHAKGRARRLLAIKALGLRVKWTRRAAR